MKKAQKIETNIKELFDSYSINYREFFTAYDDDEETFFDIPIIVNGSLDMDQVERAATILGTSTQALMNMDDDATMRWYRKYPYFFHKTGFDYAYKRSFHNDDYDRLRLLEVLTERDFTPKEPTRYNYKDVVDRLNLLLKEVDKSIPGTYHENAKITNISILTENFCHFMQIHEMVESYIDMIDRAKELFFKAWDAELTEDEIQEYNIIVSAVGLQDLAYLPSKYLYYDLLRKFVGVYRAEGYKDFFSYVRIKPQKALTPWKCAEFGEDKELAQKFENVYPAAKQEMRKFAMKVSYFKCYFTWSDAKPIQFPAEDEAELEARYEMFWETPDLYDKQTLQPTLTYVPKTADELNGDDSYSDALNVLAGPGHLGGILIPKSEIESLTDSQKVGRMQSRVYANSQKDV